MRAKLIRIGNSRGVRIPRELLQTYSLTEGDEVELERRRDGILLQPIEAGEAQLSYADAYQEMVFEAAEVSEWSAWDASAGDGVVTGDARED